MFLTELERCVEIELTPQRALAAATTTAVNMMQRRGRMGITVGALASFVVLDQADGFEPGSLPMRLSAEGTQRRRATDRHD